MLDKHLTTNKIETVLDFVESNIFLQNHVLDAQAVKGVLVVLLDSKIPPIFAQNLLRPIWQGPVEAYCASSVMAGGTAEFA